MQNKKTVAIILLTLFLVTPLVHASNGWGISKDWTLADPNKPIIVIPTETPASTVNSTATPTLTSQENVTSTVSPSSNSIPAPNGQTPTPTSTSNPTVTPYILPYTISFPTTTIILIAIVLIIILIAGVLLLKKFRHKEEKEPWQRYN